MSARPLSPRRSQARRSRAALTAPALAAALALAPVFAPAALAGPGLEQVLPADPAPSEMPFGDQGSDDSDDSGNSGNSRDSGDSDNSAGDELRQRAEDLPDKAENFGGSVFTEVIDLSTGILKCGLNLVTDSVPCPL